MVWVTISITILATCSAAAAVDKTLEPGALGEVVVETVVHKIRDSRIFPQDFDFLYRVAYVESHFGEDLNAFPCEGIWQLREEEFDQTQSGLLNGFHANIKNHFNINWNDLNWSSTNIPLYSGLAAALLFQLYPEEIPQTKASQANYWDKFFDKRNRTASYFLNQTEELERKVITCKGKLDIVLVLDGSNIGRSNFSSEKQFAADLLGTLSSDHDYVRKGAIVTAHAFPYGVFELSDSLSTNELRKKLLNTPHPNVDYRLLNDAMEHAINFFSAAPCRPHPKILVVLTAGASSDGLSAIEKAKNFTFTTISIGIGNAVSEAELLKIALDEPAHVFKYESFEALAEFVKRINAVVCEVPQTPNLNASVMDTLGKDQERLYKFNVPHDGLIVDLEATFGSVIGYYSYSFRKPNEAFHSAIVGTHVEVPSIRNDTVVYVSVKGLEDENSYGLIALPRQPVENPAPDFIRKAELSESVRVTWEVYSSLEKVIFKVEALTNGFIAFGITDNDEEKVDIVVGGISDDETPYFFDRYSIGKSPSKVDALQNWRLIEVQESKNASVLSFIRSFDTDDEQGDLRITNRMTHFYWAIGETDDLGSQSSRGLLQVNILEPEKVNFERTEQINELMNVTWRVKFDTQKVIFDIYARTTGYVGFGISQTGDTDEADWVVGGVGNDLVPYFEDRHSRNAGSPVIDAEQNWLLLSARQESGTTHLKFIRDFDTDDENDVPIENEEAYFLWAIGPTDEVNFPQKIGRFAVNILKSPR